MNSIRSMTLQNQVSSSRSKWLELVSKANRNLMIQGELFVKRRRILRIYKDSLKSPGLRKTS
jgi:hypothetical protein